MQALELLLWYFSHLLCEVCDPPVLPVSYCYFYISHMLALKVQNLYIIDTVNYEENIQVGRTWGREEKEK